MAKKMVRARGKERNGATTDGGDKARPRHLALPGSLGRVLHPNLPQGALGNGREQPVLLWPCGAVLQLGSDGRVVEFRTAFNSAKSPCPFTTRSQLADVVEQVESEINSLRRQLEAFAKWTQDHDEQVSRAEGMGVAEIRNRPSVPSRDNTEGDDHRIRGQIPAEDTLLGLDDRVDG